MLPHYLAKVRSLEFWQHLEENADENVTYLNTHTQF